MNKFIFYLLEFLMDVFIVGLIPVLHSCNIPLNIAVWFSIFPYIVIDIRQRFVEQYGNNL